MEDHKLTVEDAGPKTPGNRPVLPKLAGARTRVREAVLARVTPDGGVSRVDVAAFNSSI